MNIKEVALKEFQEIYKEQYQKLYLFLLRLTGTKQDAEDMVQETFYQAFLHIGQFEGRCSIYTWLCQIGKNRWYHECKKRKTLPWEEDIIEETFISDSNIEESILQKEQQHLLEQAIYRLPETYRDVLCLHIYGDISLKEISAMYGKSESWACVIYHRAKEKIKKSLEEGK